MTKAWSKISVTIHDMNLKEPVYTLEEASVYTKCSVQTLNRLHRNKKLEAKYVSYNNREYRYYNKDMLDNFMKSDIFLQMPMNRNKELLGKRFGKLTIVDFSNKSKNKGYYGSYLCKCDCGNEIIAAKSELLAGKQNSCGCRYNDLSGQKFGRWFVEKYIGKYTSPNGDTSIQYLCKCDCGNERVVLAQSLLQGKSLSCGCYKPEDAMSKYEICVMKYLEEKGFKELESYWKHKRFDDLIGIGGNKLSYDFYLKTCNGYVVIECQGGQHYFPVDLWGGMDAFEKQKEHDFRKKNYAKENNMIFIEIPYTAYSYNSIVKILDKYKLVP